MFLEDAVAPHDINLTSTVKVETDENQGAIVTVPAELRITPELLALINNGVQAQGLQLKHMNITAQHQEELKNLPNVNLEEKERES